MWLQPPHLFLELYLLWACTKLSFFYTKLYQIRRICSIRYFFTHWIQIVQKWTKFKEQTCIIIVFCLAFEGLGTCYSSSPFIFRIISSASL